MNKPASTVYEIVFEQTALPKRLLRGLVVLVTNLIALGDGPANPGGRVFSVREIATGQEISRHVEDLGDDEGYLLAGIEDDLATMTAHEFKAAWATY